VIRAFNADIKSHLINNSIIATQSIAHLRI